MNKPGKVYLVGAGPGDPGLITVKGMECIRRADVIVYDYLASPVLLSCAAHTAEIIYVGKKGGDHTLPQDEINQLIVEKAKNGATVTRLKGGDPFIFGRGGEEAEILKENDIPFEIVPGVTSAIAAPAYAGIPLTHRDYTATVAFVTGHEDPTKSESSISWRTLANGIGTIVFLMGMKNLSTITQNLMENGMAPETSVAVVRWGTTPRQKTLTGTLNTIVNIVREGGLTSPAIIVVGEVVHLRDKLKWFEKRPLLGKRIVVTRAREQASDLVKQLTEFGAECIECPTIEVTPLEEYGRLDEAIGRLSEYQWIIFTSVNGVTHFFKRLFQKDRDVRSLGRIRTAAIGPVTARRLEDFGLRTDILPKSFHAESVVEAFSRYPLSGAKILLPRAEEARPVIPTELTRLGATVDEVPVYRTRPSRTGADVMLHRLKERSIDMVTFTSSSTVKNFLDLLPKNQIPSVLLDNVSLASIGPITTDTAVSLGLKIDVTAETYTIPGLCEAIVRHFNEG